MNTNDVNDIVSRKLLEEEQSLLTEALAYNPNRYAWLFLWIPLGILTGFGFIIAAFHAYDVWKTGRNIKARLDVIDSELKCLKETNQ